MNQKVIAAALATALAVAMAATAYAGRGHRDIGRGHGALGVVYVESQGLYYDTFVPVEVLPHHGRFQQLVPMEGQPSHTEFGPGEPGYVGGRWWVDVNQNGIQDDHDMYLLCPLLPPGRATP